MGLPQHLGNHRGRSEKEAAVAEDEIILESMPEEASVRERSRQLLEGYEASFLVFMFLLDTDSTTVLLQFIQSAVACMVACIMRWGIMVVGVDCR